jgi:hypothetical protein
MTKSLKTTRILSGSMGLLYIFLHDLYVGFLHICRVPFMLYADSSVCFYVERRRVALATGDMFILKLMPDRNG